MAARLRAHRANLDRYAGILQNDLTPYERAYVERRVFEERMVMQSLSTTARANFDVATLSD